MNLTYTVENDGYAIFNNGVKWIVQDTYIPYPGETLEESATKHIEEILKENAETAKEKNGVEQLQEDNFFIAETLALALEEIEQLKSEIATIKGE